MIKHIKVNDEILSYIRKNSLREEKLLENLREETAKLQERNMQILPEQGQLISLLVKLIKAKYALEIGVFTGYSSICIARSLPENGKLICCDNNPDWTNFAEKYWRQFNLHSKVELKLADACQTLEEILQEVGENYFDFVFIDADKVNYDNYYEKCLRLLKPQGLILFDNTLWSGHVVDESFQDEDTQALRKLNIKLHHDNRIELSMLPFADGLTLVYKK